MNHVDLLGILSVATVNILKQAFVLADNYARVRLLLQPCKSIGFV